MTLADAAPPVFSPSALLLGWDFEPLVVIPILVIGALYLLGYQRVRRQPRPVFPPWRAWSFAASLVATFLAVDGPLDTYSDVDIAVHMVQHVVLIFVVTPLAVFGAPMTVALRALSPAQRSRYLLPLLHSRFAHLLTRPLIASLLLSVDLLASHFTAWYNESLVNQHIHDLEHLSYIVFSFLLWEAVLPVDPIRDRASAPHRILGVVLTMPTMAIIGAVFILAGPLYPYYTALPAPWGGAAHAQANQAIGGAIMWAPGLACTLAAVFYLAAEWFREDEARRRRIEALEDARARSKV